MIINLIQSVQNQIFIFESLFILLYNCYCAKEINNFEIDNLTNIDDIENWKKGACQDSYVKINLFFSFEINLN